MRLGRITPAKLLIAALAVASTAVLLVTLTRRSPNDERFREDAHLSGHLESVLVDSHERNEVAYGTFAPFSPAEGASDLKLMAAPYPQSFGEAFVDGNRYDIAAIALSGSRPRGIMVGDRGYPFLFSADGLNWYEYDFGASRKPRSVQAVLNLRIETEQKLHNGTGSPLGSGVPQDRGSAGQAVPGPPG